MSSTTGRETTSSALAIAQEDSKLKAVQITKHGASFEILWAKSSKGSDVDWARFAGECGLSVLLSEQTKIDRDNNIVIGFNSAAVAFYHIDLPEATEEETSAMIKIQAETLLPLPANQMELTWRTRNRRDGKLDTTIAAARKENLKRFVENVQALEPAELLLDCEGVVKVWKELFAGDSGDAVIISLAARSMQVCLAENGRLINSVVLYIGAEDFSD